MMISLNQTIETKKPHACGCNEWTVIRIGADYKLRCNNCNHVIMVDQYKLEKMIKQLKNEG